MGGFLLRQLARKLLSGIITADNVLKVIVLGFSLLRKGTGAIPGTWDDEYLDKFEAGLDKEQLAAAVAKAILDMIDPALANVVGSAAPADENAVKELEAEADVVVAAINTTFADQYQSEIKV